MINEKAFSLVEVLATLVILGIVLLIAVPSVTNLSNKSKEKQITEDAKIFAALVKNKVEKDTSIEIANSDSANFTLKSIDKNKLSGVYADSSYVNVSSCVYNSNEEYVCVYQPYLYPTEGNYGYEINEYKENITKQQEHYCSDKEWC